MRKLTGKEYGELFSETGDDALLDYPIHLAEMSNLILPGRKTSSYKYGKKATSMFED